MKFALGLGVATSFLLTGTARADVTVGPRVSYYFDNSNLRTSDLDGLQDATQVVDEDLTQQLRDASGFDDLTVQVQDNGSASNSDQVGFPMIGGMINFGGDRDRFTFTGMYGKGEATTELVSSRQVELTVGDIGVTELSVIQTLVDDEVDRIDVEMTWQRRLNENFAILAGARYERLDISGTGIVTIQQTDGVQQFVADILGEDAPTRNLEGGLFPTGILTSRTLETYSTRVGVTAFVPFSEGAVAFFNGMVQGSYQPASQFETRFFNFNGDEVRAESRTDSSELSIGPDFAVGAQFMLAQNIALDLRYRAILYFPLSGDFDFGDSRVNHGMNVGVSFRL